MKINIYKTDHFDREKNLVFLQWKDTQIKEDFFNKNEIEYIQRRLQKDENIILINRLNQVVWLIFIDNQKEQYQVLEEVRKAGYKVQSTSRDFDVESIIVTHNQQDKDTLMAFLEGFLLGAYKFTKYFTKNSSEKSQLKEVGIWGESIISTDIEELKNIIEHVYQVRDLINEPVSELNALVLAERINEMCTRVGCKVDILHRSQIEALKMGGLLAVNKGSIDPPTFTIVEWKPNNRVNDKPYILVGKGVVYDTGGLSLKPTADSMDYMKSDMSGAAIVAGVVASVAANRLPIHIIALVPATDNRPSGNAYAPGDVVTIMNGTTVEVLNTDAEGRMILADALVYAQRFNPELVIDVATLTGSASMAIGPYAMVVMGTASEEVKNLLHKSALITYERMVEFPLWEEYDELIKSDIADIKNVGGKSAGAIVGGKFLQRFTNYPWMHFDIAGVAFSKTNDNYRGKGGTGFGVRMLYHFFKNLCKASK